MSAEGKTGDGQKATDAKSTSEGLSGSKPATSKQPQQSKKRARAQNDGPDNVKRFKKGEQFKLPLQSPGINEGKRHIKLIVEYNGKAYEGFQLNETGKTIQGELEIAIFKLTGQHKRVKSSSRTDAGVHAQGQVACFKTDKTNEELDISTVARSLCTRLPADICVRHAVEVPQDFDVRSCASKQYNYTVVTGTIKPVLCQPCWFVPQLLDVKLMQQAVRHFLGEHDFTSFANKLSEGNNNKRTLLRCDILVTTEVLSDRGDLKLEAPSAESNSNNSSANAKSTGNKASIPTNANIRQHITFEIEAKSFVHNMGMSFSIA